MEFSGKKILIVDDEKGFLESLSKRIELMGLIPVKATSGAEALELIQTHNIDLAIVDFHMPEKDGLETIAALRMIKPGISTILLTGYGNKKMRQAAEALHTTYFEKDNMRAFWAFIKKMNESDNTVFFPYSGTGDAAQSSATLKVPEHDRQPERNVSNIKDTKDPFDLITPQNTFYNRDTHWLIGGTGSMEILKKKIANAATIESHILIVGEEGTGKEIVARAIHSLSQRNQKRFIGVNCSVMTSETLEKELWGIEKAPLSSQASRKAGLLESCHEGTIFLDNIHDMKKEMQQSLARVIDQKSITPYSRVDMPLDIRIMASIPDDIASGMIGDLFSRELYDHLSAFMIRIPPLRDRKDDIAPLCSYFMDKFGREYEKHVKAVSDEVLAVFSTYAFPGNVQELANLIERAVLLIDGNTIELRHLPEKFRNPDMDNAMKDDRTFLSLSEVEKNHILKVTAALGQNRTKAADVLGISRGALWRKLKQYGEE